MACDLPRAHAARIHRHDLLIEGGEATLVLGDELRVEAAVPVAWDIDHTRNRDVVHKIGVTTLSVAQRIAGARLQPTFLMADVEVVASYQLDTSRNPLVTMVAG